MPGNSDVAVVQVLSFAALLEPSESCLQEQALLTMFRVLNGDNPFIILNHSLLLAQESCIPPSPIRILQAPHLSYRRPLLSDAPSQLFVLIPRNMHAIWRTVQIGYIQSWWRPECPQHISSRARGMEQKHCL